VVVASQYLCGVAVADPGCGGERAANGELRTNCELEPDLDVGATVLVRAADL
jgi:hypothetical protein